MRPLSPSDRFTIAGPHVVHETMDDEVVIVNFVTGAYYNLEKLGTVTWSYIQAESTVGSMIVSLLGQYAASANEVEQAVEGLLRELQQEDLIRATESEPIENQGIDAPTMAHTRQPLANTTSPTSAAGKLPFEQPILHKYTDVQEMMLTDPVHQVAPSGWPNRK